MTNSWTDIKNADVVWIMGGNAAEAHPCGFKWVTEAKATRGAQLMVCDPRFTRSAAVSDHYAPLRPGSDIAFLSGVVNYLLENEAFHREYVRHYTNAAYIVKEEYGFADGLFTGYDAENRRYDRSSWEYELAEDGTPVRDLSLQHPRCVFQLMKQHFSPYTPEMVERVSGTPQDRFLKVCEMAASTGNGERSMTIMYALGWTQHSHGSQNIRTAAMIQLLLGNMGVPGGGINALRGHSNVQGLTDMGTLSGSVPGYLAMPTDAEASLEEHLSRRAATFRPLRPGQLSYWQNYPKFYVSFLKTFYGDNATPENDFGYDMFPKMDISYDTLTQFERMDQGLTNIFFCQGYNPIMSVSHKDKLIRALSKLKLLVSIDPLETETVRFWENHGDANNVNSSDIQTEVFMLPAASFAEDDGTFTNSSRNIIWKWKASDLPGEARRDGDIVAELFLRLRSLYEEEGGPGAEQFLAVSWDYSDPAHPDNDEILREINGRAPDGPDQCRRHRDACRRRATRHIRRDARRRLDRWG
jgi:formate dehydrogenase-N alpha subunit